jgi:hypothetical protein
MVDSGLIGTNVRNWLHYDSLSSSFYKQFVGARKVRDDYEMKVIGLLRQSGMENAVIQINGGRLSVAEEKKPNQLSLTKIQELLHSYYKYKGGKDETLDIMQFIRGNRGYEMKKTLRKYNMNNNPVPTAPQVPQLQ